jgi:Zn-dependent M28 family amino/carboxypeptidase
MAFGPRPTGSPAHAQTGDYILAQLGEAGWQVEPQPFTYQGIQARNIIGKAQGGQSDSPPILVGAHYDTRLRADQDLSQPEAQVPGANDGASGAAVLLELAFVLDLNRIENEVWLAFFDAEDNGYLDGWDWIVGSRYFADNMTVEPVFVIVVDMVGDVDQQFYLERNSDPNLSRQVWGVGGELGYGDVFVQDYRYSILDDHTPFLEKGIPAVDIIDFDYPYWHTTQDTVDKVSADSLERVGRTLQVFLEEERWRVESQGVEG